MEKLIEKQCRLNRFPCEERYSCFCSQFNYNNCTIFINFTYTHFDVYTGWYPARSRAQFFPFLFFFTTIHNDDNCCPLLFFFMPKKKFNRIHYRKTAHEDVIIYEPFIILHNVSMVTFTASNPYMVKVGINFHRKCSSANIIYFKSFHVYSSWIEMIEIHVDR